MAKDSSYPFWKNLRILILLMILLVVAIDAWRDKNQDWNKPIIVQLHPINADGSLDTQHYIQQLRSDDFKEAQDYLIRNSAQYRTNKSLFYIQYGREIINQPPKVPSSGKVLDIIIWSLKFRYYAWKNKSTSDKDATVTLYLNYYSPKQQKVLKHSTALENGRIGIVNLFADQEHHDSNQVVLVHELLHTFGATDKYDLVTGQPIDPIGLGEPNKQPKYPQTVAEIMGGYIATSPTQKHTPNHLDETVLNSQTALEIGWIKK